MKKISIAFVLLFPFFLLARQVEKTDPWEHLRFLEGTWEGTGDGMSGVSSVVQKYSFVFNGQFLHMATKAVFEPQDKNPEGEIHEDFGVVSFDRSRNVFVLRSFYIEGFVNHYIFNPDSQNGNAIEFATESVENAPPGTKAKLIFIKINERKIEQSFHVAFPGQEFSCFSTNTLEKK